MRRYLLLLSLPTILLNSCLAKMALNSIGVFDATCSSIKLKNRTKDLVFIGMHHIGKKEFYENVKSTIDSLHNEGYIVFYEQVTMNNNFPESSKDSVLRKYRKIAGNLPVNGYLDTEKGTIMGKKFNFVKDLVNQPKGVAIGLDSVKDKNIDITLPQLIQAYETKNGVIVLETCDFKTALKDKYICNKIKNRKARNAIVIDYRNEVISKAVINSPHQKIVILYGEYHFKGLYKNLHDQDSIWHIY